MKIMAIADKEDRYLWDHFTPEAVKDVDLIISCGDLKAEYLEFLVTMANVPLLYVHGNHDHHYDEKPPLGCTCIDGRIVNIDGLRIGGLGGCMRYKEGPHLYSESEMARRARKLGLQARIRGGLDILVTHAPADGYGDMDDRVHKGFRCFNSLLDQLHPQLMLYGHVHPSYTPQMERVMQHPSGAQLVNIYEYKRLEVTK